ncbi:MAG: tRNA (adenosine(37)-N6)-threonylcarbamoyltransferase complex dimerization subunit type 1 TsaB [Kiritimatiellia bacterium]
MRFTEEISCVLAVEQSTCRGSAAILRGNKLVRELSWFADRRGNQELFSAIRQLSKETDIHPAQVELFGVGIGPGSFSGLRSAVAAITAMALPGGKPVRGVSSGEALAWTIGRQTGCKQVAVVGDARRQLLWVGIFKIEGSRIAVLHPWCLVKSEDLTQMVPAGSLVVTSDWPRIGAVLQKTLSQETELVREAHFPSAEAVGHLALLAPKPETKQPAVITPIYLHSPVLTEPSGRQPTQQRQQECGRSSES